MCTILGYGLPERETYCILHVYKAFAFSSFYRIPSALPLQSLEDCTVTHTVYIMYECIVRPGRIWHKKGSLHLCEQPFIQQFNCQPQFQCGNPPDSIPLWVAAREDNTLSSRLTRPSHFPSVSFYYFTYIGIWPGSYQDYQIKNAPPKRCIFYSATSYPSRPFQASTFGPIW